MPRAYALAHITMAQAPEWLALAPERREALELGQLILRDLKGSLALIGDLDVPNGDATVAACIKFVRTLGKDYRARMDPHGRLDREESARMVTIAVVQACARGRMSIDQALNILRIRYPSYAERLSRDAFDAAVEAWRQNRQWKEVADLVRYRWRSSADGRGPENLRILWTQWKRTAIGRNVMKALGLGDTP